MLLPVPISPCSSVTTPPTPATTRGSDTPTPFASFYGRLRGEGHGHVAALQQAQGREGKPSAHGPGRRRWPAAADPKLCHVVYKEGGCACSCRHRGSTKRPDTTRGTIECPAAATGYGPPRARRPLRGPGSRARGRTAVRVDVEFVVPGGDGPRERPLGSPASSRKRQNDVSGVRVARAHGNEGRS